METSQDGRSGLWWSRTGTECVVDGSTGGARNADDGYSCATRGSREGIDCWFSQGQDWKRLRLIIGSQVTSCGGGRDCSSIGPAVGLARGRGR